MIFLSRKSNLNSKLVNLIKSKIIIKKLKFYDIKNRVTIYIYI